MVAEVRDDLYELKGIGKSSEQGCDSLAPAIVHNS